MSKSIDERVVELRFDNKQFEEGASQSMSTLDKLKEKLNFKGAQDSFKKIDNASSSLKFTVLSNAVETVHAKFSALEIVGITALQRITNQAIDTGERLVKSLSIDQISTGFDKYNTITTNVQTLVNSTGKSMDEIYGYLEKLNWYSDETSYGLTDMTSALSEMSASGGDIDKLIPMIIGVANATAFAGKSAQDFKYALQYGINQAYGLGYLGSQDWKSITRIDSKQLRQALIDAGELLGTIEKGSVTVETFKNTLKDQWVTTEVMEKAFSQFATTTDAIWEGYRNGEFESYKDGLEQLGNTYGVLSARAAASAQEAKTLQEAIDATKDAVSSGWLNTFQTIFGNYNEAKRLWSDTTEPLWDIFAGGAETRNAALADAFDSSWAKIKTKIRDAGIDLDDFSEKFLNNYKYFGRDSEELKAVEKVLEEIEYGTKTLDDLFAADRTGAGTGQALTKTLREYADTVKVSAGSTDDLSDRLSYFQNVVDRVWSGEFKNAPERFQLLADAGYDYAEVQRLVDLTENGRKLTLEDLNDEELKAIGYTEEQVAAIKSLVDTSTDAGKEIEDLANSLGKMSGRELLRDSILNVLESIASIVDRIRNTMSEAIGLNSGKIYSFLQSIYDFTERISPSEETLEHIHNLLSGIVSLISSLGRLFSGAFRFGLNIVRTILDEVGFSMGGLADSTGNVLSGIAGFLDSIDPFGTLFDWLEPKIRSVTGWFVQLFEAVKNSSVVASVVDTINTAVSNLKGKFEGFDLSSDNISFQDKIAGIFEAAKAAVLDFKDNAITYLTEFKNKVVDVVSNFSLRNILDAFGDGKQKIEDFVTTASNSSDKFPGFLEGVKTALGNFVAGTGTVAEDTAAVFGGMWQGVRDAIDDGFGGKALVGGSLIISLLGITSAVKGIANAAKAIANPVQLFTDSVTKILKPITNSIDIMAKASIIRAVAMVVLSLAASFYMISNVDTAKFEDAKYVMTEFIVLLGVIFALVGTESIISQIANKSQVFTSAAANLTTANIGKQMLNVALSLIGIGAAFKVLDTINPDNIGRNALILLTSLAVIAVVIGVLGTLTEHIQAGTIKKALGNKLTKLPGIGKIFTWFGYKASDGNSKNNTPKAISSIGNEVLKIASSIIAFTIALKVISKISNRDISKSLGVLAELAGGILVFLFLTSRINGNSIDDAGKLFEGLGKAFLKMSIALGIITLIGAENAIKAAGVLAVLGVIAVLVEIAGFMSAKTKEKQFLNPGTIKNSESMFKGLGTALLEMSIAIAIIASIDTADAFKAAGVLAVLGAVVGAIEVFTTHFGTTLKQGESQARLGGSVIVSIATALLMLSVAIIALSTLNTGELLRTTGVIAFLLLEIGAIIVLTTALGKDNKTKGTAATIAALDVALGLLLGMLLVIAKVAEPDELEAAGKAIGIALGTLALLVGATKIPGGDFKNSLVSIGAATAVVIVLGLLMSVMADLYKDTNPESIETMTKSLIIVSSFVIALAAVFGGLSKWVGKTSFKKDTDAYAGWGAAFIGMATAIGAVVILANAIGPALEGFSSSNIDDSKIGAFAATMGVLVGAVALIAGAMVALIKIGVVDSGTNNQMKILQAAEFMGLATIIVAGATALLGLSLRAFEDKNLSEDKLLAIAGLVTIATVPVLAIGSIMALLAKTMDIVSGGAILKIAGVMLLAVGVIDIAILAYTGLATLLDEWGLNDRTKIQKTTDIISDIIVAIFTIGATIKAKVIEIFGNTILTLLNGFCDFIERAADACGYFIDKFKGIDRGTQKTIQLVIDAIGLLIADTLVAMIAGFMGGPLGTLGMLNFLNDMALIGSAAIAFVDTIKGKITSTDAETAKNVAIMIKNLADGFDEIKTTPFEKIVNWATGKTTTDLEDFGNSLAALGEGANKFVTQLSASGVNADNVKAGVEAINVLTGLNDIIPKENGLWQWITGSSAQALSLFADNMEKLGLGLIKFTSYIANGTGQSLNKSDAELRIDEMAGVVESVSKFDQTAFDSGYQAIKDLAEIEYPDNPLLIKDDVSKFAENLTSLGSGLKNFEDGIKDITDWTKVTQGIGTITGLVDALAFTKVTEASDNAEEVSERYLPDLRELSNAFTDVAGGITTIWEQVALIDDKNFVEDASGMSPFERKMSIAIRVAQAIVNGASSIAAIEAGSWAIVGDKTKLDNFITGAKSFGTILVDFYNALYNSEIWGAHTTSANPREYSVSLLDLFANPNNGIVGAMQEAAYTLGEIAKAIQNAQAINPTMVQEFADSFATLASVSITDFVNEIGSKDSKTTITTAIDNAVQEWSSYIINPMLATSPLTILSGAFDRLGRNSVNGLAASMDSTYSSSTGIGLVITKLKNQLEDLRYRKPNEGLVGAFTLMGHDAADEFAASITTRLTAYVSGNIPEGGADYYGAIVELGRDFARGFAKGIADPEITADMLEKVGDMVYAAADTIAKTQKSHSPSKVTEKLGQFFSQGFINGILSKGGVLKDAITNFVNGGSDGISGAVSKALDLINNGVDTNPTITPVLNLDEITSGIGDMNSMFDNSMGTIDIEGYLNNASLDTLSGFDVNGLDYNINEYLTSQNGVASAAPAETVFNYTQNNYSPKSLSNLDIYRNTKNQLASLKKGLTLNA